MKETPPIMCSLQPLNPLLALLIHRQPIPRTTPFFTITPTNHIALLIPNFLRRTLERIPAITLSTILCPKILVPIAPRLALLHRHRAIKVKIVIQRPSAHAIRVTRVVRVPGDRWIGRCVVVEVLVQAEAGGGAAVQRGVAGAGHVAVRQGHLGVGRRAADGAVAPALARELDAGVRVAGREARRLTPGDGGVASAALDVVDSVTQRARVAEVEIAA